MAILGFKSLIIFVSKIVVQRFEVKKSSKNTYTHTNYHNTCEKLIRINQDNNWKIKRST